MTYLTINVLYKLERDLVVNNVPMIYLTINVLYKQEVAIR